MESGKRLIKLFMYTGNFGDSINAEICKDIFGCDVQITKPRTCQAAFIGSLLEAFLYQHGEGFHPKKMLGLLPPVEVWGTGFMAGENQLISRPNGLNETFSRRMSFRAVRGKLTLERIEKILGRKQDIVLGDPGLLASELLSAQRPQKKYRVGIVPHYVDFQSQLLGNIDIKESTVIDVTQEPIECLKKIAQCEVVLSSSLHGLIISDSLGIPNFRIKLSDNIVGGDYKYNDYFSNFTEASRNEVDLRSSNFTESKLLRLLDNYYVDSREVDSIKKNLFDAFPYK